LVPSLILQNFSLLAFYFLANFLSGPDSSGLLIQAVVLLALLLIADLPGELRQLLVLGVDADQIGAGQDDEAAEDAHAAGRFAEEEKPDDEQEDGVPGEVGDHLRERGAGGQWSERTERGPGSSSIARGVFPARS
jgi:hypothetical protein